MSDEEIRAAVSRVLPGVMSDLGRLVRIPSVSADPARFDQVRRSAAATAQLFSDAGFPDVAILSLDHGLPAVVARRPPPNGAPTVLLYAHHDVQPEGAVEDWLSEPFTPTRRGERLFGRGAADDKAGIAAHLAAILAHDGDPPVGVTVFVEGEEEVGSPTLAAFLEEHAELLAADVIVIADSGNWAVGKPALTTSLRGLAEAVVEVRTLDHAVHSGMFGGPAPDALTCLCRLLSTLHDETGNVVVDGLSPALAADLEYPVERFRAEASLVDGVELIGTGTLVERLWSRPALSVLAIDAPRVAGASNTLIPVASAKVSLRVPPGNDTAVALDALTAHLESHVPWGARVSVTPGDIAQPFAINASGPAYDAARSAFRDAWEGEEPVDIGVGGSIPFIAAFAQAFPDAAILVTGVEDPDTRAHGANEGLHLAEFERVCLAEALLLDRLARR